MSEANNNPNPDLTGIPFEKLPGNVLHVPPEIRAEWAAQEAREFREQIEAIERRWTTAEDYEKSSASLIAKTPKHALEFRLEAMQAEIERFERLFGCDLKPDDDRLPTRELWRTFARKFAEMNRQSIRALLTSLSERCEPEDWEQAVERQSAGEKVSPIEIRFDAMKAEIERMRKALEERP